MSAELQPSPRFGRAESFALVALAYVVALAAALWIAARGDPASLWTLFEADLIATLIVFAFSIRLDNGSVYDAYWSVAPPFVAFYWIAYAGITSPLRQAVVTTLVLAWAIRLTFNWARGWPGLHHEDWRYVDLYTKAPKFLISLVGIHLVPTLQVFLGCLPLVPALGRGTAPFGALDSLALILTASAIVLETVADAELRRFNLRKQPGDIMAEGLWAWSRHPNYLGEQMFWWGLYLFGLAADPSYWWTVVGPLAMMAMFRFASIPMLDQRNLARRPGYAEHMEQVNALLPRRPG